MLVSKDNARQGGFPQNKQRGIEQLIFLSTTALNMISRLRAVSIFPYRPLGMERKKQDVFKIFQQETK